MPKVLFADDSITIRKVAERQLSEAGLDMVFVASGEEALAWLANAQADLVITDVIMPDRSGYDICAYVRSDPRLSRTPVLLITGIVNDEVTRQAATCGADAVVKKPFQGTSLRDRVLDLLAQRQGSPSSGAVQRLEPDGSVRSVRSSTALPSGREASPGAPPPAPKVYRITEEQLQAFRQAAARIRELEVSLAGEQARSAELRSRVEALESAESRVRELEACLASERDRSALLADRIEGLGGTAEAEGALLRERQEVAALGERLAETERALELARVRERDLLGTLKRIARLAAWSDDEEPPPLPDESRLDEDRS